MDWRNEIVIGKQQLGHGPEVEILVGRLSQIRLKCAEIEGELPHSEVGEIVGGDAIHPMPIDVEIDGLISGVDSHTVYGTRSGVCVFACMQGR